MDKVSTLHDGRTGFMWIMWFHEIVEGLKRAIPMRRLGEPEDYPGIVAFLASDEADYITGQTISVSGGLTMHG
jgi:2-hydroxycyclohexanecarboxyl-CoA dehydrogenase